MALIVSMRVQDLPHITTKDVMNALRFHGKSRGEVVLPSALFGGSHAARARLSTARPGVTFVWSCDVVAPPQEISVRVPTAHIWSQQLLMKRVLRCMGSELRNRCWADGGLLQAVRGDGPWDGELTLGMEAEDEPLLRSLEPEFADAGLALSNQSDNRIVIYYANPKHPGHVDIIINGS